MVRGRGRGRGRCSRPVWHMWGMYICGAYAEVPQAKGRVDGEHLVKS